MKDKPILFSGPMVLALLDGRKTMTRRIVTSAAELAKRHNAVKYTRCKKVPGRLIVTRQAMHTPGHRESFWLDPKYQPGDVLFVRETMWSKGTREGRRYADGASDASWRECGWRKVPGIHMPLEYCRLRLRVTDVKAERVQDISEEDAIREGVEHGNVAGHDVDIDGAVWNGAYRRAFALLWNSINGPGSWEANPWVWCYTFEVMKAKP